MEEKKTRAKRTTTKKTKTNTNESVNTEATKPTDEQGALMTPQEYFEYVKSKKNEMTSDELNNIYDNAMNILKKYMITGQSAPAKKVIFLLDCIEKEKKVVDAGFTQFVYRWDIDKYIEKITDDSIGIIDLENFEREIPDDKLDVIIKAKDVFDQMYVIFTDYTRKAQKKVAKTRREKDPILFGAILNDDKVLDRLYFICDWVDEQCDLTLDKLVTDYKEKKISDTTPVRNVPNLETLEDFKKALGMVEESDLSKTSYILNPSDN